MAEIDEIENDIIRIMEIAKLTTELIQTVPKCDQNALHKLSNEYAELVAAVQSKLKKCTNANHASAATNMNKAEYANVLNHFLESSGTL